MKVLIVDDSVIFRNGVSKALQGQEGIEVVGVAPNGTLALQGISILSPDIVILDLEMPELDGFGVIREVRKTNADLKILVFSDQSEYGAKKAMQALADGANDFLSKAVVKGGGDSIEMIRKELMPKLRQFFTKAGSPQVAAPSVATLSIVKPMTAITQKPKLIVIGCSTGGPEALRKIFSGLRDYKGPPILIVQHMPPTFTLQLAKSLSDICGWDVREAQAFEPLKERTAYIAPGDFHMLLQANEGGYSLALSTSEKVKSVRPAADVLFHSVANNFAGPVWAFVLTGMGDDGLDGVKSLKTKGHRVFIQDQESSVVWGMPGAIAREQLHDRSLPLNEISQIILKQEDRP